MKPPIRRSSALTAAFAGRDPISGSHPVLSRHGLGGALSMLTQSGFSHPGGK